MYPHRVFWFIIITSFISSAICGLIGNRKRIGGLVGGVIGFTFGVLAFSFIFFLPDKASADASDKLKRYRALLEDGLISRSEYTKLTEALSEDRF